MMSETKPLLGFVAFSGTGKTTLLSQVIPLLKSRKIRIGMLKHAHHDFDIDQPGKDSYILRKSGAEQVLVASSQRWALMVETPGQQDADLWNLLNHFDLDKLDLLLIEGFKHIRYPKIEVYRRSLNNPYLYPEDDSIIALAIDNPQFSDCPLPVLDINKPDTIVEFILKEILNLSA